MEGDADVEDSANAANGPGGRFFHRSALYSEDMGLKTRPPSRPDTTPGLHEANLRKAGLKSCPTTAPQGRTEVLPHDGTARQD
jgi:hypothetical protein